MEDPMLSPVTVEVAHAPSPRADLVAGHVAPAAVAQAHVAPSRKRQGNVVMQGGNPAAPAATARAPGANAVVRSRPAAEKAGKAAGVKRRKVPASRKPPYSTSDFIPPQGGAPAMPFNDAAPPASEVFDEMAGSRWAACLEQVRNAPPSGTVKSDYDKIAQHRYKDMEASEGKFFKLEHCWELLQKCEKWKLINKESPPKRGSLINMDEDEDDDGPRNLHKPDGDKKTKEKMKREQEAASLRGKIDAMVQSNELMLLKSLEIKKDCPRRSQKRARKMANAQGRGAPQSCH
ncbi:Lactation elevated protein 1 [Hordeum vulgare]|nr:Lactation elevated protein 1 [Hordeum vulgare]